MKTILFLVSLLISTITYTQEVQKNILDNTSQINSIEPSDTNYNDLAPLNALIGDERIVMLGEQDHGDSQTFKAKTRLVKYLHEHLCNKNQ